MEYLDGISLKKYLQRKGGKVPCDEILAILRPVMESLVSVHKLGLIHRDISPDNIIITKNSEVKLIDFGAAKQSNLNGKSLSIVLKQGFAPEEQYRTHGEQGPWTDIYALGVTIYYAVTGTLPPESIQRLYKDTIIRPSEKGAVISPTQESALMKSLAVYARHRYQDVTQMITGLYGSKRGNSRISENLIRENAAKQTAANSLSRPAPSSMPTPQRSADSVSRPAPSSSITPQRAAQSVSRPAQSTVTPPRPAQSAYKPAAENRAAQTQPSAVRHTAPITDAANAGNTKTGTKTETSRTITVERKLTLMERLFGKKKK